MQWRLSLQPVLLAGAALGSGMIASPAYALSIGDTGFGPSCQIASHLVRSFGAATHLLATGMGGAEAAGTASGAPSNLILFIATVFAIGLCLIIAWRLWVVHAERDQALNKVASLEDLSERDPLTGLLNRHVVEERFGTLRSQGFDTLALIDLDSFKEVNDRYGHEVGDDVLAACGEALKGGEERDYLTMRLGGEEFVVLLRGVDAYFRAEALRKTLPLKIARSVPSLEMPVTASMGLIELPSAALETTSFDELCQRADQLLSNAKTSGRDRTCFERLMVMGEASPDRNSVKSAA